MSREVQLEENEVSGRPPGAPGLRPPGGWGAAQKRRLEAPGRLRGRKTGALEAPGRLRGLKRAPESWAQRLLP